MGSHSWDDIVARFEMDEEFKKEFLKEYPQVTKETLTHAIGEYEKTLITPIVISTVIWKGIKQP